MSAPTTPPKIERLLTDVAARAKAAHMLEMFGVRTRRLGLYSGLITAAFLAWWVVFLGGDHLLRVQFIVGCIAGTAFVHGVFLSIEVHHLRRAMEAVITVMKADEP